MTDKQRKYIESLIKKVFRNADSQSEILSRLDRVKISSHQASVMIHALKLECNIGRSVPAYMLMANNLNSKMDEFFRYYGKLYQLCSSVAAYPICFWYWRRNGGVGMLISEFIQQLQDVYDEEGDMEIAIKIDDNDLGSEPIVVKSTVYEQLYIVKS